METLRNIKKILKNNNHKYTVHAQEQMAMRKILDFEVIEAILNEKSKIIEEYLDDKYSPSCLIYGETTSNRILHIQCNFSGTIITTYEPNLEKWLDDFKKRRKKI